MDDIHRHDRISDTISAADDLRIQGCRRWAWSSSQHSHLYPLLLAHLHRYLQHRDHACQPQEDEPGVLCHLRCHHPSLRHRYPAPSWSAYQGMALCDAGPVLRKCILLHIHDYAGDDQAQEHAGNDGGNGYAALREIFTGKRPHPLAFRLRDAVRHPFHYLIIYNRTYCTVCPAVLQPYIRSSWQQLHSY